MKELTYENEIYLINMQKVLFINCYTDIDDALCIHIDFGNDNYICLYFEDSFEYNYILKKLKED